MKIIDSARYSYDKYKNSIERCARTSPFERSYQEIFEAVIREVLKHTNIEIIISSEFRKKETTLHCPLGYKLEDTASPDLMLAVGFIYDNKDEKNLTEPKYYALVEVKLPGSIKTEAGELKITEDYINQLKTYLKHPAINKLIFIDGYTWVFYEENLSSKKIIELRTEDGWKQRTNSIDKFTRNLLETDIKENAGDPEEWEELQAYIYEFIVG